MMKDAKSKNTMPLLFFRPQNVMDQIFQTIKEMTGEYKSRTLKYTDVTDRCISKGFNADRISMCIEEYEELNVIQVNNARTKITFV